MKTFKQTLAGLALVGVFGLGLVMQSCSSSSNGPVASGSEVVPMVSQGNDVIAPDFSVAGVDNNSDVVALDPPRGGGSDKDTTIRDTSNRGGSDKDFGKTRMRRLPIDCLGLDSAQMVQLKLLMEQSGLATRAANDAYRAALAPIRSKDSAAMATYRAATMEAQRQLKAMQAKYREMSNVIMAQVKAGTLTREQAKQQMADLRAQFEAESKDLRSQLEAARADLRASLASTAADRKAAMDAYQAALKAIQAKLYADIAAMLTPDQLVKWNLWLNGGDPCAGKRPIK
jgi:polyhydroxyalkanoate synthesis regulator phasin